MLLLNPAGISLLETEKSYEVKDLVRGWGIYSTTIGSMLALPKKKKKILLTCLTYSIIWHIRIAKKKIWTKHHKQSIGANLIGILLTIKSNFKKR